MLMTFFLTAIAAITGKHVMLDVKNIKSLLYLSICIFFYKSVLPVMAAIAVRKKVISIGHFSPSFCFQSLQMFLFVKSNQAQLYE